MLPVVAGELPTYRKSLYYALSLLPVSVWLVWENDQLGPFSMVMFAALGLIFLQKIYKLGRILKEPPAEERDERKTRAAWDVFGFSLIYLAMFFVVIVLDSTLF